MWLILIGSYYFGWIHDLGHQILWDLGGSDCPIPLRVSSPIWVVGSRSDGRDEKGEGFTMALEFRRVVGVLWHWNSTTKAIWWLPMAEEGWTRIGVTWRSRGHGRRACLRPSEGGRRG
jgi:hypothetical protein